jgi:RNA recognition motif-containing protein
VWCFSRQPRYGLAVCSLPVAPEKAAVLEVKLYVRNLPKSMTGKQLTMLFAQAGDVTAVNLVTDRQSGGSRGYAFITMSAQSEADKAVSMFDFYSLDEQQIQVALTKPREQRGFSTRY